MRHRQCRLTPVSHATAIQKPKFTEIKEPALGVLLSVYTCAPLVESARRGRAAMSIGGLEVHDIGGEPENIGSAAVA